MATVPEPQEGEGVQVGPAVSNKHYRNLLVFAVLSVSLVAIIPLIVMTGINYYQYQQAFQAESVRPIMRFTANAKLTMEAFLSERVSVLSLVTKTESPEDLQDSRKLNKLLNHMKRACGGFVDLGMIDGTGKQVSYAGPYQLLGKNYKEQEWYHEVALRGVHVSDVFQGHRHLPHFVIAVSFESETTSNLVLRATIDTDRILRQMQALAPNPSDDAFLVNRNGVLQTSSRFYGAALEKCPIPVPPVSTHAEVLQTVDETGESVTVGYAYIERSPFILMLVHPPTAARADWLSLRRELVLFLILSICVVLAVVFMGSKYMVNRTREADLRRAAVYHKMEYTNKMAAIGRLAAGVAHEINNPLAIIDQKAGLHKDLLQTDQLPSKEKMLGLVDAVLESVKRCGNITHRLLGFAKHMDVQQEQLDVELLLKGVLGFLEKEAGYRNLDVSLAVEGDVPPIVSDRGQLQQVFLNIINNAYAAVDDGGRIRITVVKVEPDTVRVNIEDNGVGIPSEHLKHVFEPFFTTKKGAGTGLGLSITYGIIQKLGGQIAVTSTTGKGSTFTVSLPVRR